MPRLNQILCRKHSFCFTGFVKVKIFRNHLHLIINGISFLWNNLDTQNIIVGEILALYKMSFKLYPFEFALTNSTGTCSGDITTFIYYPAKKEEHRRPNTQTERLHWLLLDPRDQLTICVDLSFHWLLVLFWRQQPFTCVFGRRRDENLRKRQNNNDIAV